MKTKDIFSESKRSNTDKLYGQDVTFTLSNLDEQIAYLQKLERACSIKYGIALARRQALMTRGVLKTEHQIRLFGLHQDNYIRVGEGIFVTKNVSALERHKASIVAQRLDLYVARTIELMDQIKRLTFERERMKE